MVYRPPRRCSNPRCGDTLHHTRVLCPSCQFVGKVFFAIGAAVAGALMKLLG